MDSGGNLIFSPFYCLTNFLCKFHAFHTPPPPVLSYQIYWFQIRMYNLCLLHDYGMAHKCLMAFIFGRKKLEGLHSYDLDFPEKYSGKEEGQEEDERGRH